VSDEAWRDRGNSNLLLLVMGSRPALRFSPPSKTATGGASPMADLLSISLKKLAV
jgi:hypothetical protein